MNGLGVVGKIVLERVKCIRPALVCTHPEHVSILQVALWVSLLGVNEVGELGWIANEENGGIVKDPIPVSFLSSELDSKATGIARSVGRSILSSDSGEANCGTYAVADLMEEGLGGDVAQIMGDLEVAMGTSSLGMNLHRIQISVLDEICSDLQNTYHSLWDSFTIKVSKEIDVVEIYGNGISTKIACIQLNFLLTLEQERPVDSSTLGRKRLRYRRAVRGSIDTGGHWH